MDELGSDQRTLLDAVREKLAVLPNRELGPVLSGTLLEDFERRHGVKLPPEYRQFLLHVGNGGSGPGYGLDTFDPAANVEHLAEPFPLKDAWIWDDDPAADPANIDACFRGWLKLGTEGCGMDWVLVVAGAARGQVWNVEGQGAQPCAPRRSFLEWYAAWLDWRLSRPPAEDDLSWWRVVWRDAQMGG